MRYIAVRGAAVGVLALGLFSASAEAQGISRCGDGQPAALRLHSPKALAFGRSEFAYVAFIGDGRNYSQPSLRMSVGPAGPTQFRNSYESPFKRNWQLKAARGDGDALVRVSYLEFDKGDEGEDACRRVLRDRVQVKPGVRPGIRARRLSGNLFVDLRGTGICTDELLAPVGFRLRGTDVDERFVVSDICGDWDRSSFSGTGLEIETAGENPNHYPRWVLEPTDLDVTTEANYTLTIKVQGERIGRVRFEIRWFQYPRSIVYEGQRRFKHYCVKKRRDIRSRDGRLFCVEPATNYQVLNLR